MSRAIRMFFPVGRHEDPSRDGILKPHLQHTWDPTGKMNKLLQNLTGKLQCSQAGDVSDRRVFTLCLLASVSYDVNGLHVYLQVENKHTQLLFRELTCAQPCTEPKVLY